MRKHVIFLSTILKRINWNIICGICGNIIFYQPGARGRRTPKLIPPPLWSKEQRSKGAIAAGGGAKESTACRRREVKGSKNNRRRRRRQRINRPAGWSKMSTEISFPSKDDGFVSKHEKTRFLRVSSAVRLSSDWMILKICP